MEKEKSPKTHPLEIYFKHNLWSNLILFDACLELDEAQMKSADKGTYGPIHATLGHIIYAEEYYALAIGEKDESDALPRPTAATPFSELRARMVASGEALLQLAITVDGNSLIHVGTGEDASMMPIEALLLQAIHHGYEHRTQIETMMGQMGVEPPGLSGWRYFDEEMQ